MRQIVSLFRWLGGQFRTLLIDEEFERKLAASPRRQAAYRRLEARRERQFRAFDAAFDRGMREAAAMASCKPLIMVDWKPGETMLIQDNPMIEKRWRI